MKEDKKVLNAFALVGFIFGLLSVALYWVFGIVPVLAIIFSIIGLVSAKKLEQKGKGFAITGLVLGIVFILAFGLQIFLSYNNYFNYNQTNNNNSLNEFSNDTNNYIGTWKYIFNSDNYKMDITLNIKDYTYTYTISTYLDNKLDYSNQRNGTVQFIGNKALLYQTQYINVYNAPKEMYDLMPIPAEIEYKNGTIEFNSMVFEKIK